MTPDQLSTLTAAMTAAGKDNDHSDIYEALHEDARWQVEVECGKLNLDQDDLTDDEREQLELAFKDAFWSLNTPTDLHTFGAVVLEIMANEPEWNDDLLDRIAAEAYERKLATGDKDGLFTIS